MSIQAKDVEIGDRIVTFVPDRLPEPVATGEVIRIFDGAGYRSFVLRHKEGRDTSYTVETNSTVELACSLTKAGNHVKQALEES